MESAKAAEKQCGMDKLSEVTEKHKYLARLYKRYGNVYIDEKTVHMCLVEIRCLIDISILKDHLLKHRVIGTKQLDNITNHYHSCDDQVDDLLKSVGRAGGKHGYFLLYVSLCESSEEHRGHEDAVDELKKKAKEMGVLAPESILCACRMLQQQKLKQDEESSAGEADLAESGYESDKKHSTFKCSSGGEADLEDESIKKHSTYKCSSGGDCTISDYSKGSECCMSAKNGFHSLCLTKSSYEELQLDMTLSKQSEVLLEKFADVAVNTFEGLSKIAFEDAQRYTNHLVSTGIYDSAVFNRQPITNCISETTSHKELEKELMENYYSWFNFSMIKNLRKKFLFRDGYDELMQSYEDEFSQYCRRRCFESPLSFHPRPVSTNLKSLVFKTDANYGKYTLLQARKITVTVASIINSPDHAIYVESVKEGCVEVSCYILPQFVLKHLNDLQISQLKENNIFSFKIEDKELMPKCQHQDNHFEQSEMTSDSDGYDASGEEESDSEDKRTIISKEDTFEAAKKEVSISEDNHCTRRGLCSMSTYISDGVVVMKTMVNCQELKHNSIQFGEKVPVAISEATKTIPNLQNLHWNSVGTKGAVAILEAMPDLQKFGYGCQEAEQFLVNGNYTDPNAVNKDGDTALHLAARKGNLDEVQNLVSGKDTDLNAVNKYGETALHVAAQRGHLEIVKLLLNGNLCQVNAVNKKGETALHLTLQKGNLDEVQNLVSGKDTDLSAVNKDGWTPLHLAAQYGCQVAEQFLVNGNYTDPNAVNKDGDTALHLAARKGNLDEVQNLVSGKDTDLNAVNKYGETALHVAARKGYLKVVQILVNRMATDPNVVNKDGDTALHIALKSQLLTITEKSRVDIVTSLLKSGRCNPNIVTSEGQTPLDMTNVPELIRVLLDFGANTKISMRHNPTDTSINMFVLGNVGAGKSTIVKAISTEAEGLSRLMHRISKVTDVDQKTAGIIPYKLQSKALGLTSLYDFAGHKEYYAGHDALLANTMTNSPSVIALLVDMRDEEEKIRETVQYWFQFINNHSHASSSKTHLVIISSHADELLSGELKKKARRVQSVVSNLNLDNITLAGQFTLDCRYAESSSMTQLRSTLAESCKVLRGSEKISAANHYYLIFLLHHFKEELAVTLDEVATELMMKCNEKSDELVYPEFIKSSDLFELSQELNERGPILFMKNHQDPGKSCIVLKKDVLLSQVNSVIFAPEGFKEHSEISTNTGVVPLCKLALLFPNVDIDVVTRYLCHLEFCHEIKDADLLSVLEAGSRTSTVSAESKSSTTTDERFFFFPGLVSLNKPQDIALSSESDSYSYSGWVFQCSKPEQFFSYRFHQVLLLRLAFSFASAPSDQFSADSLVLRRRCQVWKNGIFWANRSGGEAIVEIVDMKKVVATIASEDKIELSRLRSSIINTVINAKKQLCSKVAVKESLLLPEDAMKYPLDLTAVNINDVAETIKEGTGYVLNDNHQKIKLERLVGFEPYANLGEAILEELFDEQKSAEEDLDKLFFHLADRTHQHEELRAVCQLPLSRLDNELIPRGAVHRLAHVFQQWRDELEKEGTRKNFQMRLDQFSVFAGRNPLFMSATDGASVVKETDSNTSHPQPPTSHCHESTVTGGLDKCDQTECQGIPDSSSTLVESPKSKHPCSHQTPGDSSSILGATPELCDLLCLSGEDKNEVRVIDCIAPNWKSVALALSYNQYRIDAIEQDYRLGRDACLTMFKRWLNGEHELAEPRSWGTLIKCLNRAGFVDVATKLKKTLSQ